MTFMKTFRSQSAMEYLMTYGWAIIIVAIVLGALFQLGFFNGTSVIPQGCIAQSGYYCSNPILSTTGVLTLTVGQATGTQMNNTILYFVPSGSSLSHAASVSTGTLSMGQTMTVSMQLPTGSPFPSSYALGTQISGTLYLGYVRSSQVLNSRFGTISIKVTSASGASLQRPNSIPSGISTYVPITLSNSQSSATPAPFQQMVQFSESTYSNNITYNGNAANFEFFDQNGQVISSWIESNNSGTITAWLKLPNGITALNSTKVYLGFAPKSTNMLSSSGTSGIGEAPQLSTTYAQYDDGASVFPLYDNFAGTTLPSKWTVPSGSTYIVNNGFIATPNAYTAVYDANIQETSSIVIEWELNMSSTTYSASLSYFQLNRYTPNSNMHFLGKSGSDTFSSNTGYTRTDVSIPSTGIQIFGIWNNRTTVTWFYPSTSFTATSLTPITDYLALGWSYNGQSYNFPTIYFVRTRACPPSGVMPSVSFGGVS